MLSKTLSEIQDSDGYARTDDFTGLRAVDGKVREVRMVLAEVPTSAFSSLIESMGSDPDFEANSRRVRLEALANYVQSAITLLGSGAVRDRKQITRAPDVSRLTTSMPGLKEVVEDRWLEAQKCAHIEAHLAAVVLMGSILEGLLLARASLDLPAANRSLRAPKDHAGKVRAIQDWNLSSLIEVAVNVGWLKVDRGKFSHALRESRNVVHPWVQISQKAAFDASTCRTCWAVLTASVDDLLKSVIP